MGADRRCGGGLGVELVRRERLRDGRIGLRCELAQACQIVPAMGGGVKACVAHGVLAFRGCVPEDAGDEFGHRQGKVFALGVVVVEVGEGHGVI